MTEQTKDALEVLGLTESRTKDALDDHIALLLTQLKSEEDYMEELVREKRLAGSDDAYGEITAEISATRNKIERLSAELRTYGVKEQHKESRTKESKPQDPLVALGILKAESGITAPVAETKTKEDSAESISRELDDAQTYVDELEREYQKAQQVFASADAHQSDTIAAVNSGAADVQDIVDVSRERQKALDAMQAAEKKLAGAVWERDSLANKLNRAMNSSKESTTKDAAYTSSLAAAIQKQRELVQYCQEKFEEAEQELRLVPQSELHSPTTASIVEEVNRSGRELTRAQRDLADMEREWAMLTKEASTKEDSEADALRIQMALLKAELDSLYDKLYAAESAGNLREQSRIDDEIERLERKLENMAPFGSMFRSTERKLGETATAIKELVGGIAQKAAPLPAQEIAEAQEMILYYAKLVSRDEEIIRDAQRELAKDPNGKNAYYWEYSIRDQELQLKRDLADLQHFRDIVAGMKESSQKSAKDEMLQIQREIDSKQRAIDRIAQKYQGRTSTQEELDAWATAENLRMDINDLEEELDELYDEVYGDEEED